MKSLTRELTSLQAEMYARHAGFRRHASSRAAIASGIRKFLAEAKRTGHVEVLFEGERIRAALLLARIPAFFGGKKLRPSGRLLALGGDRVAQRWLRTKLLERRAFFNEDTLLQLDGELRSLLPTLARCGVHVHSLILSGDPGASLRALERHYRELDWESTIDFRVERIRTTAQAAAILRIIREEFTRNPQFGSFLATPIYLKRERARLLEECRQPYGKYTTYVILDRTNRVRGAFGFERRPRASRVGQTNAGVFLDFGRDIQGRGLARRAYATMFRRMIELGIRVYIGGTAQKPVLKLSRLMGRPRFEYAMSGGRPYFPLRYFRYPK